MLDMILWFIRTRSPPISIDGIRKHYNVGTICVLNNDMRINIFKRICIWIEIGIKPVQPFILRGYLPGGRNTQTHTIISSYIMTWCHMHIHHTIRWCVCRAIAAIDFTATQSRHSILIGVIDLPIYGWRHISKYAACLDEEIGICRFVFVIYNHKMSNNNNTFVNYIHMTDDIYTVSFAIFIYIFYSYE